MKETMVKVKEKPYGAWLAAMSFLSGIDFSNSTSTPGGRDQDKWACRRC